MKSIQLIAIATLLPVALQAGHTIPGAVGGLVANQGDVVVRSDTFVDSYNSDLGYYGRGNVSDQAKLVAQQKVVVEPDATIKGIKHEQAYDLVGMANMPAPSNLTSSGAFVVGEGGYTSLSAGDYLFDSFTVGAGAYLEIAGQARIWVKGNITISGEVENWTGKPGDLWIMGTDTTSQVRITGADAVFLGNIYAPTASVLVSQAEVYGCLTGATLEVDSGSSVHFDEATPQLASELRVSSSAVTEATAPSRLNKMVLGPVPSYVGEPVCLFAPKPINQTNWNVFNVAGERVANLQFGAQRDQCWVPQDLADGVYLVQIAADYFDGSQSTEIRKVLVRN